MHGLLVADDGVRPRARARHDQVVPGQVEGLDGRGVERQQRTEAARARTEALQERGVDTAVREAALRALLVVDGREDVGVRPQVADLQEDAVRAADAHQEVVDQGGLSCPLLRTHPRGVYGRAPWGVVEPAPRASATNIRRARPTKGPADRCAAGRADRSGGGVRPERRRRAVFRSFCGRGAQQQQEQQPRSRSRRRPRSRSSSRPSPRPPDGSGEEADRSRPVERPEPAGDRASGADAARAGRGHAGHRPARAAPSLSRRSARPGVAAIAVSYSGAARRRRARCCVEVASGLEEPPLIACPPGPARRRRARARHRGVRAARAQPRAASQPRGARGRAGPARGSSRRAALAVPRAAARTRSWRGACAPAWPRFPRRRPGTRLVLQHNDLLPGPLIARALRRRARQAELVVVPSQCVARDLDPRAELGERAARDPPRASTSSASGPRRRRRGARVLLLGAIEPWKRPDLALEAVALAARELPELRLTVAGEPVGAEGERLLAELRRRAERPDLRDRVDFAGRVDDPERLLAVGRLPPPLRRARALRDGRGRGARVRGAGGGPRLVRPRRARRSGLRPPLPARRRGGRGARPDGRPQGPGDGRRGPRSRRARPGRIGDARRLRAAARQPPGRAPARRRPRARDRAPRLRAGARAAARLARAPPAGRPARGGRLGLVGRRCRARPRLAGREGGGRGAR